MTPASVAQVLDGRVEVQVWRTTPTDARSMDVLDEAEQVRASRFRQPEDRDRFVTGRFALRSALSRRIGVPPKDVVVEIDTNHRPFCSGGPSFSLSHSGEIVLLALSNDPELDIGIDVEREDRRLAIKELAGTVCTDAETTWLRANTPGASVRFLELWTAKEAALKCTGKGLGIDPRLARYDPANHLVTFAPETFIAPLAILGIAVPPEYRASLAAGHREHGCYAVGAPG